MVTETLDDKLNQEKFNHKRLNTLLQYSPELPNQDFGTPKIINLKDDYTLVNISELPGGNLININGLTLSGKLITGKGIYQGRQLGITVQLPNGAIYQASGNFKIHFKGNHNS